MRWLGLIVLLPVLTSNPALASCDAVPGMVRTYLQIHPGEHIVSVSDLGPDDQQLWRQYHYKLCPGMAAADLDGSGKKSYALVVQINKANKKMERAILLRPGKKDKILSDWSAAYGCVIWRAGPGKIRDFYTGRRTLAPHDAIVFERMESAARTFFVQRGKLQMIQTSD